MINSKNSIKRILIIEDEEDLRNLYFGLLTGQGYTVDQAADGEEAYNKIKNGGFDLVLLDIMLPQMDGFEVLEKLIATKPLKQSVDSIVLLTNLSQDQTVARGTELGVMGYMIKSDYNPKQFLDQITEFLTMVNQNNG